MSAPLKSSYAIVMCSKCRKTGHEADACTQTKAKKPAAKPSQPHKPVATSQSSTNDDVKSLMQSVQTASLSDSSVDQSSEDADDEVDMELFRELVSSMSVPATAQSKPAASAPIPRLPLCFMCQKRHEFGECPVALK